MNEQEQDTTANELREIAARAAYEAHLRWREDDGWGYPPDWDGENDAVHHYWRKVSDATIAAYESARQVQP